jgi:hypothetical protein
MVGTLEYISTMKKLESEQGQAFTNALKKIATAGAASSRAAIEASNATKPSRTPYAAMAA